MQLRRLFYCLVNLFGLSFCTSSAFDAKSTNDLFKVVAAWKQKTLTAEFRCVLSPEWIGIVEENPFTETGKALGETRPVRLDRMLVVSDWHGGTNLALAMSSSPKTHTYHTVFRESLPSVEILAKSKSLSEVEDMLGQPAVCDAGICNWLLFTVEPERTNQIRVLTVSVGSPNWEPTKTFKIHVIGEGILHPADPNSQDEIKKFKSGRNLSRENEIEKSARRTEFPMPLRRIIKALETPDDFNLNAYHSALNHFRNSPSRELMQQFVESIQEGTCQVSGMVNDFFFDKKLEPWANDKRQLALREFTNALPRAKTPLGLTDSLWIILEAEGGGELVVNRGGKTLVDVAVKVQTNSKHKEMGASPNEDQLPDTATACRDALKEKYPHLR